MNRRRVLIVDNDEDALIALERVLEEQGFETCTSWNLDEALKELNHTNYDAVLVGDHPPELNCEKLLKRLREGQVHAPCIVLHGSARYPFSEQYLYHLGACGVACKWSYGDVASLLKRSLN